MTQNDLRSAVARRNRIPEHPHPLVELEHLDELESREEHNHGQDEAKSLVPDGNGDEVDVPSWKKAQVKSLVTIAKVADQDFVIVQTISLILPEFPGCMDSSRTLIATAPNTFFMAYITMVTMAITKVTKSIRFQKSLKINGKYSQALIPFKKINFSIFVLVV